MIARLTVFGLSALLMLIGYGLNQAMRDPVVRTASVAVKDWPEGQGPLRLVLISDIHIAGPDMSPERLRHIVDLVNAERPDIVLIAGDMVSDKTLSSQHYPSDSGLAPLAGLKPRLGTVAVLGNHDHWRDPDVIRATLERDGITVLFNDATKIGPLVIGGADDDFTHRADPAKVEAAMDRYAGPRIILSHSPDIVPNLPAPVALVAAGHTHCGQANLPLIGIPLNVSRYGLRYQCGLIDDNGQKLVVTAGLGTSGVPMRLGVPPDLWVLTLHSV